MTLSLQTQAASLITGTKKDEEQEETGVSTPNILAKIGRIHYHTVKLQLIRSFQLMTKDK
jgi:hypothetical protein